MHLTNKQETAADDHMLNATKRFANKNCLSEFTHLPKKLFKSSFLSNMANEKESLETLLNHCKKLVPNLSNDKHKGESGRIGVFGGSKDYTGAPYFTSMSALRTGADLVYVFCAEAAAQPIKSYSPELMVVPYLDVDMPTEEIHMWIKRLHVAVIGPGLGRNAKILQKIGETVGYLKHVKIPLVIDADGLFFISQNPKILKDYEGSVYLTPNINEYKLLVTGVLNPSVVTVDDTTLKELSKQIGNNVTVILKAKEDRIVNGDKVLVYPVEGSPRRCGGQGDMLSGCLAAFSGWAQNCKEDQTEAQMFAAFAASTLVKTCSKITFKEKGRGMIVTDMLAKLHTAFDAVYEDHKEGSLK